MLPVAGSDGLLNLLFAQETGAETLPYTVQHISVHLVAAIYPEVLHKRPDPVPVLAAHVPEQPFHIARHQYVHGWGAGLEELPARVIDSRVEEIRQYVVGIRGYDEPARGHAHLPGHPSREAVSEISARDAEIDYPAHIYGTVPDHRQITPEIIGYLRQKAPDVDGVR